MSGEEEVAGTLSDELQEIMSDLHPDLGRTISDLNGEVFEKFHALTLKLLGSGRTDAQIVDDLTTVPLWMFMIGREHHARGYASPVEREQEDFDLPDLIEEILRDEGLL